MEKLSISNISSISRNIFRATPNKVESNQTNPFGVSFKGNVLTADVFQTANDTGLAEKAANKSKMLTSAIVGSISNLSSAISARLNTVANFGRKMKANVVDAWKQAQSIEIHINPMALVDSAKTAFASMTEYSVSNLTKRPVSDLSEMFTKALAEAVV